MSPFDIFSLLAPMIQYPFIALIIASVFAGLGFAVKNNLMKVTALIWALYGIYEYAMYFSVECIGACIRIDLLLIYTVLILLSIIAVVSVIYRKIKPSTKNS